MANPPRSEDSLRSRVDAPDHWRGALTQLIEEKTLLCRRLDALSKGQRDLIDRGDTDALLTLLSERQDLIGRLRAVQEEMTPFRERWDDLMQRIPPAEAQSLKSSIDKLTVMVRDILERDDADRAALDRKRSEVLQTMTRVGVGQNAMAAYAPRNAQSRAPMYHDGEG